MLYTFQDIKFGISNQWVIILIAGYKVWNQHTMGYYIDCRIESLEGAIYGLLFRLQDIKFGRSNLGVVIYISGYKV